jgi:hypothetical protein
MDGACSLQVKDEKILEYLLGELGGREHLENSCIEEFVAVKQK